MIGILLMSHGRMAEGVLDSATLFFGDDIPQIKALCLMPQDDPESFSERIDEAIKEIDDGHGVLGFCDLYGGTPSNRSVLAVNERFQCIPGMNFTMVLEFLGQRMAEQDISEVDIDELCQKGRDGIVNLYARLKEMMAQSSDDEY